MALLTARKRDSSEKGRLLCHFKRRELTAPDLYTLEQAITSW